MDKPVNYLAGALMLLFGAALGTSLRASEAYLPRIGPPTLRFAERLAGRPLLKRLANDLAGRNLTAALNYLASLKGVPQ